MAPLYVPADIVQSLWELDRLRHALENNLSYARRSLATSYDNVHALGRTLHRGGEPVISLGDGFDIKSILDKHTCVAGCQTNIVTTSDCDKLSGRGIGNGSNDCLRLVYEPSLFSVEQTHHYLRRYGSRQQTTHIPQLFRQPRGTISDFILWDRASAADFLPIAKKAAAQVSRSRPLVPPAHTYLYLHLLLDPTPSWSQSMQR